MALSHRPTQDWIVVRIDRETRAEIPKVRGLYQPGAPDIKPKKYGEVVAVGPGRVARAYHAGDGWRHNRTPLPCAVGDTVMMREVAGEAVVVDGEELLWCIPDEILAVVDKPA